VIKVDASEHGVLAFAVSAPILMHKYDRETKD